MPEFQYTVRAGDDHLAKIRAQRSAESDGVYVLRIITAHPVGPWTEDGRGEQLFDVTLQGDRMSAGEARAMDGNR